MFQDEDEEGEREEKIQQKQPIIALAAAPFRNRNMLFSVWEIEICRCFFYSSSFRLAPRRKLNLILRNYGFLVDHKNGFSFRSFWNV